MPDFTGLVDPLTKIGANQIETNERLRHLRLCMETLINVIQTKDCVIIVKPAEVHPVAAPVQVEVAAPQVQVNVPELQTPVVQFVQDEEANKRARALVEWLLVALIIVLTAHGILNAYQAFKPGVTHAGAANS